MRLAVVDVGSNAVNLLITDTQAGAGELPLAARAWKARTRLAQRVGPDGTIAAKGVRIVAQAVTQAIREARQDQVDELFTYATATIRDAPNGPQVADAVHAETGVRLSTLTGVQEAQMTFLAARRWVGWRAGPMLLLDIGGGTLEVAFGRDRLPETALSLPLGAGRLTRELLHPDDGPVTSKALRRLRRHVREQIATIAQRMSWEAPRTAVAASTTFHQLARLTGAAPQNRGPFVERRLERRALAPWIEKLAAIPAEDRAALPGVSTHRAAQILAGAVVGYELMHGLNIDSVTLCPWGLREGILLRRLEARSRPLDKLAWAPLPDRK